jgi:hypothetical protein
MTKGTMTVREAVILAQIELGKSCGEAELKAAYSDVRLPDAAPFSHCPVRPGMEREFIEFLKQFFHAMDRDPEAWKAMLEREVGTRARRN